MRFPDPSSLGLVLPFGGGRTVSPMQLNPQRSLPPSLELPHPGALLPHNLDPSQLVVIPPRDNAHPDTPAQNDRRYDQVLYGDSPSRIDDATTRFVLNNPNGATRDGNYDHLTEFLFELLEIGVDVIQLLESNVDWRHPQEYRKCRNAVTSVFKHANDF
jgi:hypothetical protein